MGIHPTIHLLIHPSPQGEMQAIQQLIHQLQQILARNQASGHISEYWLSVNPELIHPSKMYILNILTSWQDRKEPRWSSGKESACWCERLGRRGFNSWVGRIPWRRKWQPTPGFLPVDRMDRIPWTEESGQLWPMVSQRAGHAWAHTQTHRLWSQTELSLNPDSISHWLGDLGSLLTFS